MAGTDGRLLRDVDCISCGRFGHYAEQCPHPRANTAVASPDLARAYVFAASGMGPKEWLVDSAANFHVSANKHNMTDFRQPSEHLSSIVLGKGMAEVKGMGTLYLRLSDDGSFLKLSNVLWTPGFNANLFAAAKATAAGDTIIISKRSADVVDKVGALLFSAPARQHGMCSFFAGAVPCSMAVAQQPAAAFVTNSERVC